MAIPFGSENSYISEGHNLIGVGAPFGSEGENALDPFTLDPTNLLGVAPGLGPLADNGGPTPTHALLPGSPAIDGGDPTKIAGSEGTPEFDQRGDGYGRVVDALGVTGSAIIDIGAFEVQARLPTLPGDYNRDGQVDSADYTVWRDNLGDTVDHPFSGADGDGNGLITRTDYLVWRAHFGQLSTLPSSTPIQASVSDADDTSISEVVPGAGAAHDGGGTAETDNIAQRPQTFVGLIPPLAEAWARLARRSRIAHAAVANPPLGGLVALDEAYALAPALRAEVMDMELSVGSDQETQGEPPESDALARSSFAAREEADGGPGVSDPRSGSNRAVRLVESSRRFMMPDE